MENAPLPMNCRNPNLSTPPENSSRGLRWPGFLAIACLFIALIAILLPRPNANSPSALAATNRLWFATSANSQRERSARVPHFHPRGGPAPTAAEIVSGKVIEFARSRRQLLHALAGHFKVDVPDDVERFFDAVESGRWEEVDAAHKALLLSEENLNQPRSAELHQIWRAIQETWGAAREAHNWPAQTLLDYGNAILDSLRPGMVYVGGKEPCRVAFIL